MPHITLLYPFLERGVLTGAVPDAQEALGDIEPFALVLGRFEVFRHRGGTVTLWLAPEPKERLVALQTALVRRFPECDATGRFAGGFTPHLSVGQVRDDDSLQAIRCELEPWKPLTFEARSISIIVREAPPVDVFRTVAEVTLGGAQVAGGTGVDRPQPGPVRPPGSMGSRRLDH